MKSEQILVDTNVLIQFFRLGGQGLYAQLLQSQNELMIAAATLFEFRMGFNDANREACEAILQNLRVLPFDAVCATTAAELFQYLKRRNSVPGERDLYIAATALAHNLPLATLNTRHFEAIPRLQVWAA
jgi:predicted nucleic acid-binding protein